MCISWLCAKKYECSDIFFIYKYVGVHTCGVEHATGRHKKISYEIIALLNVNYFRDGKGLRIKKIKRIVFREMHCNASYRMCWKESVIAKNIVCGTLKHKYSCLSVFSYMVESLNPGSSYSMMVNKKDGCFMYYFLSFGACI